jgi:hypothetical protein
MISKERFKRIRKGDVLIFSARPGKPNPVRYVMADVTRISVQIKRVNRGNSFYTTTTYTYYDLCRRIIAIAKPKNK